MLKDYVPLPVKTKRLSSGIYIFPCRGEVHGCAIDAVGSDTIIGTRSVFKVSRATTSCSLKANPLTVR
jgi:hypothetical protein